VVAVIAAFLAAVSFGIEWVAASYVLRVYVLAPLTLSAAARVLDQRLLTRVTNLVPSFLGGCAMAVAVVAVAHGVHSHLSAAATLASLVLVAVAAYGIVMITLAPTDLADARRLALRAVRSGA
jgi:PST family polysaccharide transporter